MIGGSGPGGTGSGRQGSGGQAFTFVELLVVLAIVSILSAIATSQLNGAKQKARIARAEADLAALAKAFELLHDDTGAYPLHLSFDACSTASGGNPDPVYLDDPSMGILENPSDPGFHYENWKGPYIKNPLVDPRDGTQKIFDPWGRRYIYDPAYWWKDGTYRAIHSGGPNQSGMNVYDEDNVVKLLCRWETGAQAEPDR